jgi:4-hydroxy-2-oxoheptanedioate aldolase
MTGDIRRNRFVERLQAGEIALGGWLGNGDLHAARSVGETELDFVFVDMEHSGFDFPALGNTLQWLLSPRKARQGRFVASPSPIVRIPANASERNEWLIKQALDYGASGVLVPRIQSAEDAACAIRAARYSRGPDGPEPRGQRGVSPGLAMRYWGCDTFAEYFEKAELWPLSPEGEVIVIFLVEDQLGFENIEEIAATPGLGALLFGAGDGGVSLGGMGARGRPGLPGVAPLDAARARVVEACRAADVPVGTVITHPAAYDEAIQAGFSFVATGAGERNIFADIIAAPRRKRLESVS